MYLFVFGELLNDFKKVIENPAISCNITIVQWCLVEKETNLSVCIWNNQMFNMAAKGVVWQKKKKPRRENGAAYICKETGVQEFCCIF